MRALAIKRAPAGRGPVFVYAIKPVFVRLALDRNTARVLRSASLAMGRRGKENKVETASEKERRRAAAKRDREST